MNPPPPKFFINSPSSILPQNLLSVLIRTPSLLYYPSHSILLDQSQLLSNKVRLLCGGGSGHEPAHLGFVGDGMLTGCVCGDIYASPTYKNIEKAIDLAYGGEGLLLLVKNYAGDVMNFGLAKEMAAGKHKKIEMIIVNDDISLVNLNEKPHMDQCSGLVKDESKRRGLCGIVYLYKILGSLAKNGCSFEEIRDYARNIAGSLYTVGITLTPSVTPLSNVNTIDYIPYGVYEVGLGIHGEKGNEQVKQEEVKLVIEGVFMEYFERNIKKGFFELREGKKRDVNVIVNNLGSLNEMELNIIFWSVFKVMDEKYRDVLNVKRYFCGKFMTSLEMKGFSITLADLDSNEFTHKNKENILFHLDTKNEIDIFRSIEISQNYEARIIREEKIKKTKYESNSYIKSLVLSLCQHLIKNSDYLNNLDKEIGDGDLGTSVEKGCNIIIDNIDHLDFENHLNTAIKEIGSMLAANYGGTSGPLLASFLLKGSGALMEEEKKNMKENWLNFFLEGSQMMQNLGKAQLNDKTMVDILLPLADFFLANKEIEAKELTKILYERIDELIVKIKSMKSKRGRSLYQQGKEVGKDDPGSILISLIIKFLFKKFN